MTGAKPPREPMPPVVKMYLWLLAASAILLAVSSNDRPWLWEPFAIFFVPWAGLRIWQLLLGKSRRWESSETTRNRNTGRARTPRTVHIISGMAGLLLFWYLLYGAKVHPLPGMPHQALLYWSQLR